MRGTLNSTPNGIFRVEFFANEKANATRYGDGQRVPGAIMVGTDSDGNADINATFAAVSTGQFISATATRPGYNASEFSQVVEVNPTTSGPSASGPSISAATTNANDQVVPRGEDHPWRFSPFPSPSTWHLIRPRAVDLRNYHLFAIGRNGVVGSSKGRTLALRSATYNSSTHTVTLIPKQIARFGPRFQGGGRWHECARSLRHDGPSHRRQRRRRTWRRLCRRPRPGKGTDATAIEMATSSDQAARWRRAGAEPEGGRDDSATSSRRRGSGPKRAEWASRPVEEGRRQDHTRPDCRFGRREESARKPPLQRRLTGRPDALHIPLFVSRGTSMGHRVRRFHRCRFCLRSLPHLQRRVNPGFHPAHGRGRTRR